MQASFQPVLLRNPEPRVKPAEDVAAPSIGDQAHSEPKTESKTVLLKPQHAEQPSPKSHAPNTHQPRPSSSTPGRVYTRAHVVSEEQNKFSAASDPSKPSLAPRSAPTPSSGADVDSHRRVLESAPPSKPVSPLFHLLGDFSQFQLSFSSELKSLIAGADDWFPSTVLGANPSMQGEVLVIGVIGSPQSGKSTLLNAIAAQCSPLGASPAVAASHLDGTPASTTPSILQQLLAMKSSKKENSESAQTKSSLHSRSLSPFPITSNTKTILSPTKAFSIDMSIMRKPNGRIFEYLPPNASLRHRVNEADCIILLEAQSLIQSSMLAPSRRAGDNISIADVRNQETALQLLSKQLGVFMLSVCNIVVAVDDTTCNSTLWKHCKTLEMLKWTFPEMSELYHSSPSLTTLIPQLKQSFLEALKRETYEKIMLDVVSPQKTSSSSSAASVASKQNNQGQANNNAQTQFGRGGKKTGKRTSNSNHASVAQNDAERTESEKGAFRRNEKSRNTWELAADLTIDEQKVNEISGALDEINLYSPEQEYLPSIMFAFNKCSTPLLTPQHEESVGKSLSSYFANSAFLTPENNIPFCFVPLTAHRESTGSHGSEKEEFVRKVLSLPSPRFRKPLNPREWLIAASWMWDIIKHSQVMANYHSALKQADSSRSLKEPSSSVIS